MKIFDNLKLLFTGVLSSKDSSDIRLPLSKLAGLWDNGRSISTDGVKGRPTSPYAQIDTVWTCVNLIIDISLGIQLMLSTAEDDIVEDGPVYAFLFNNPAQPYKSFLTETLGFYLLFREVYWITDTQEGLKPTHLRVVGPRQMEPIVKDGTLIGYLFTDGRKKIALDPDEVYCIKNFNPDDPYRGLGPYHAGTLSLSVAYQAARYSESSLANGARLSTVLSAPAGTSLTDPEIEKLKREFRAKHSGAANASSVFFAQGGVTVDTVSQTMADLQMLDMSKYTDQKICSLFGVPPECVGLITEAQYAQGPATQRLILFGVAPVLSALAEGIDDGIVERFRFTAEKNKTVTYAASKRFCGRRTPLVRKAAYRGRKLKALQSGKNVFVWFDVDSHPAIQEMLQDRTEKMLPFVKEGIPLEQIVDAGDLPFDTSDLPWAKEWWISAGLMPARWILDGGPDAVLGPQLPEGDTGEDSDEEQTPHPPKKSIDTDPTPIDRQKASRIWHKYIASWLPLEKEFQSAIRSYFRRQKADLLKQLEANSKGPDDILARIQFDLKTENKKLVMIHKTFFERAASLGAGQIAADVAGQSGAALKKAVDEIVRRQAIKQTLIVSARNIQLINTTTAARVARTLRQGLDAGEGLPELRQRLQQEASFSIKRAQRIARTHTGSAVSAGRHESAKYFGADKKFWLTSKDAAVRKSHAQAERDHADGIGLDQAFKVGGDYLLYPGDPGGSPANVVNCRCMELVKTVGKKSFTLDDYDRAPMLDYTALKSLLNEAQNV